MQTSLIADVQKMYAERPDHTQFVDASAIDAMGLTQPEVIVLCALLLNEGRGWEALVTAQREGLRQNLVESAAKSLEARELILRDPAEPTVWHLDGAERMLRMQTPDELEQPEDETPGPPSINLVLRSLRQQMLMLVRSGTPVEGLSRVFCYIYGGTPAKGDYAILGMMIKLLGRDKAALLLLEFAHQEMRQPLHELVPIARARAGKFRPADAPDEGEQRRYLLAIAAQAKQKRGE